MMPAVRAAAARLPWSYHAPLGTPVVPLVQTITTGSSARTRAGRGERCAQRGELPARRQIPHASVRAEDHRPARTEPAAGAADTGQPCVRHLPVAAFAAQLTRRLDEQEQSALAGVARRQAAA